MAKKTVTFAVRMDPEDRDAIRRLAAESGLSQSELVTRRVLGRGSDALEARIARLEGWAAPVPLQVPEPVNDETYGREQR